MRRLDTGTAVEYLWIHLTAEEGIPEALRRFHSYSCIWDGVPVSSRPGEERHPVVFP